MEDAILYFDEIGLQDVGSVGRKNASLGEIFKQLSPKGILVPDGFATTASVYRDFLKQNNLERKLYSILNDLDKQTFCNLSEIGNNVRFLLSNGVFPYYTQVQIIAAYKELVERVELDCPLAVRSSAVTRAQPEVTFAGQLECYLNIKGENALLEACKNCFVSLFTDKAIKHSIEKKCKHLDVALSVGVQQMIGTTDWKTPVAFTLNKKEQQTISNWSDLIEDHFKMPMNIEWMRDSIDGKLYVLQASPGIN